MGNEKLFRVVFVAPIIAIGTVGVCTHTGNAILKLYILCIYYSLRMRSHVELINFYSSYFRFLFCLYEYSTGLSFAQ